MLCTKVTDYLETWSGEKGDLPPKRVVFEVYHVDSPGQVKEKLWGMGDLTSPAELSQLETSRLQFLRKLRIHCHPRNELAEKVMMKFPSSTALSGEPRASLEALCLTVGYWNPGEEKILVVKGGQ